MLIVRIAAYELIVEIQADSSYPDAIQDITNRAIESFTSAVEVMQKAQITLGGADELQEENEE